MSSKVTYLDQLAPIESYDEFGNKLGLKATSLLKEDDIKLYFNDKIEAMKSFSLGIYQWCIVDFADQKLFEAGGMSEEMTDKPHSYWKGLSADKYIEELCFKDHIPHWMGYINFIYSYLLQTKDKNIHPHIYIKMKNKEGVYRNVVMQIVDWRLEADGGIRYCLCQITDIAHFEIDYLPQMSILVKDGKEIRLLKSPPNKIIPESVAVTPLTPREIEVIKLLSIGMTSKLIADKLHVAKNTIENHRQRLLKKTNSTTSSEVVAYAMNHGLI